MAGLGFARSQLEKQGWTEGKGLGKEEDGITKAIKVGIKNDTRGVGYKISDQFTFHWWDHVFNKTAKSIVVNENEEGVHLSKDGSSNQPISNKKPNKHSQKPLLYGRFVKASSNAASDEAENGSESTDDEAEKDFSTGHPEDIVFKACGGRTAHKGARHGLKLNGKLKRIEEHERMAISAPCSRSASPDITKEHDIEQKTAELLDQSKSKKKKRRSNDDVKSYSDSEGCLVKKKKKESKKKRRHIEETELENELYEEQSKKKRKNNSKKDFCEEKEESSSCSSLPKTKKKRKDRNRMEGNVNDKIEKKKKNKSLDSNDNEQCSGLENQQNTEEAKTKKDKAKTKDSIAKSKEKVVTEDKKRKTKKRKANKNETISRTKTNDNELRSESEESSARKKKKKNGTKEIEKI